MNHVVSPSECNFYIDMFYQWIARHEKCVSCNGDYLEKCQSRGLNELVLRNNGDAILCSATGPAYMILLVCLSKYFQCLMYYCHNSFRNYVIKTEHLNL